MTMKSAELTMEAITRSIRDMETLGFDQAEIGRYFRELEEAGLIEWKVINGEMRAFLKYMRKQAGRERSNDAGSENAKHICCKRADAPIRSDSDGAGARCKRTL